MKTMKYIALMAALFGLSSCLFETKYTVGGTVTGLRGLGLVLEDSSRNALTVGANGAFTFGTGVANGNTYSVTVRTQPSNPTQTCTVHNGAGTIAKASISNVMVTCTKAGQFAYVANEAANTISAYVINSSTGALAAIAGSPFGSNGTGPIAVAVDPNGNYLYVANSGSHNLSVYAIGSTGALSPAGIAIATGGGPAALAIDPTDHYLYVANSTDNTVSAFAIGTGTSSALVTAISGSPFAVGREPAALKTGPNGKFLYVTNLTDGTVTVLAIAPGTGALTPISGSPFAAGSGAVSIAIDPAGTFAYVANAAATTLAAYSINASTGALTTAAGSPLSSGSSAESLVVNPAGSMVYAANVTSNNEIAAYAITPSTGELTLRTSVSAGTFPVAIAMDPLGHFVFAANFTSGNVSVFNVNATTGALTTVAGSPFAAGSNARSIAID